MLVTEKSTLFDKDKKVVNLLYTLSSGALINRTGNVKLCFSLLRKRRNRKLVFCYRDRSMDNSIKWFAKHLRKSRPIEILAKHPDYYIGIIFSA